jgi:hypothetical protein
MSKYEFGEYENGEPFIIFHADGRPIIGNYDNSALYTHGKTPHIDHFFVQLDEDDDRSIDESARTLGAFVWRHACEDFDSLANALIENDFVHIHKPYPSECDVESYEATIKKFQDVDKIVEHEMEHLDDEIKTLFGE